MADQEFEVEIPNRAAFKAAEVCDLAKLQPYVLRSWESEFPDLGLARTPGGPRVYRRSDVERVLRIRQLVFAEGLTLAGVRRRLEGAGPTPASPQPPVDGEPALFDEVMGVELKSRLARLKDGLRSLFDLLSRDVSASTREFRLQAPAEGPLLSGKPKRATGRSARRS
jgi:DNA-binding transcriptional MerR regulator